MLPRENARCQPFLKKIHEKCHLIVAGLSLCINFYMGVRPPMFHRITFRFAASSEGGGAIYQGDPPALNTIPCKHFFWISLFLNILFDGTGGGNNSRKENERKICGKQMRKLFM